MTIKLKRRVSTASTLVALTLLALTLFPAQHDAQARNEIFSGSDLINHQSIEESVS